MDRWHPVAPLLLALVRTRPEAGALVATLSAAMAAVILWVATMPAAVAPETTMLLQHASGALGAALAALVNVWAGFDRETDESRQGSPPPLAGG